MSEQRPSRASKPPSPGDALATQVRAMVRVDHAGEVAAVAIYQAQQQVFGAQRHNRAMVRTLHEMELAEHVHLNAFNGQLRRRRARPTALIGLWQPLSHALGVVTALMGENSAHACTEAVEEVIEAHYQGQIDVLEKAKAEPELLALFRQFRTDELQHRDAAVAKGARKAPAHALLTGIIKAGCRTAIRLSEKI